MTQQLRLTPEQYAALNSKRKATKYRAVATRVDGIKFDSTKEARCWQDMCLQQQAGQITELRRQIPFAMVVNGHHVCEYWADFVFKREGKTVVMDAKGFRTEIFKLKRKLMLACHGIEIRETHRQPKTARRKEVVQTYA